MYVWHWSVQDYCSSNFWKNSLSSYNNDTLFWCPCVTFHYGVGGQRGCILDLFAQNVDVC